MAQFQDPFDILSMADVVAAYKGENAAVQEICKDYTSRLLRYSVDMSKGVQCNNAYLILMNARPDLCDWALYNEELVTNLDEGMQDPSNIEQLLRTIRIINHIITSKDGDLEAAKLSSLFEKIVSLFPYCHENDVKNLFVTILTNKNYSEELHGLLLEANFVQKLIEIFPFLQQLDPSSPDDEKRFVNLFMIARLTVQAADMADAITIPEFLQYAVFPFPEGAQISTDIQTERWKMYLSLLLSKKANEVFESLLPECMDTLTSSPTETLFPEFCVTIIQFLEYWIPTYAEQMADLGLETFFINVMATFVNHFYLLDAISSFFSTAIQYETIQEKMVPLIQFYFQQYQEPSSQSLKSIALKELFQVNYFASKDQQIKALVSSVIPDSAEFWQSIQVEIDKLDDDKYLSTFSPNSLEPTPQDKQDD